MEGLLITTVVMDIIAVVCSFFLRSESSKAVIADRKEVQILAIFKNKKAFLFVISLAIFSIAWLLINFFYVVKLENCGLPVEWMSLIILSYSAVQMLAEPILGKLSDGKNGKSGRGKLPAVTAATAGVAFLLFGVVKFRAAVLLLMLILPLLLNLPEYLLMDLENQFVDEAECGSQRAATLSVLNMGVNLVEILTLSASSSFSVSLSIFDENRNPVVLCVCGMLSDGDSASICQNTKIEGAKTASSYQNDP